MSNIRDIAKEAEVSVSTVSRVLNNHPHVSQKTREHVMRVIEEHDFTVNRNAVKLSTGKTNIIGVVVPEVNHECYDTILQGILYEAEKIDYNIMLLNSSYTPQKEMQFLELLRDKEIDGLIFVSKTIPDDALHAFSKFGAIANCKRNTIDGIMNIYPKRLESYRDIYHDLHAKQCHPIFVTTPKSKEVSQSTFEKEKAYLEVIHTPLLPYLNYKVFNYQDGYEFSKTMFAMKQDQPIGIHTQSDQVAAGIVAYATEHHYVLNKDFFIISEGNTLTARLLNVKSIEYQLPEVGALLFRSLFDATLNGTSIDYHF